MLRNRLFLSAISLVLVCVGLALPTRSKDRWITVVPRSKLKSNSALNVVPLANPNVQELVASLPAIDQAAVGVIFRTFYNAVDTHSLEVFQEGREVSVRVPTVGSILTLDFSKLKSQAFEVRIEHKTVSFLSSDGSALAEAQLPDQLRIAHLQTTIAKGLPTVSQYQILLAKTDNQSSKLKMLLFLLSICLVLCLLLKDLISNTRPRLRFRSDHFILVCLMAVLLFTFALVLPPLLDDGWVIQTVEHRFGLFEFPNFRNLYDLRVPLGGAYFELLRPFIRTPLSLPVARIFPVLLVLATAWYVLHRMWSRWRNPRLTSVIFLLGVAVSSAAWLISVRPEGTIACLLVLITLLVEPDQNESASVSLKSLAAILAAVGLSIHTTGIVLVGPLIWSVARDLSGSSDRTVNRRSVLIEWISIGFRAASTWIFLVFYRWDIASFRRTSKAFASTGLARASWRDEPQRYVWLFGRNIYDTVLRRESVLLLFFALGMWIVRSRKTQDHTSNHFAQVLGTCALLLTLTPSKWPWHFGSVGILTAVVFASELDLTAGDQDVKAVNRRSLLFTGSIGALVAAISFGSPNTPGGDLARMNVIPSWIHTFQTGLSTLWPWFLLLLIVVLFTLPAKNRSNSRRWIFVPALTIISSTLLWSMFFYGSDLTGPEPWSIAKQNLSSMSSNVCGLESFARVIDVDSKESVLFSRSDSATTTGVQDTGWFPAPGNLEAIQLDLKGDFSADKIRVDISSEPSDANQLQSGDFEDLGRFPEMTSVPLWMNLKFPRRVFVRVRVVGESPTGSIGNVSQSKSIPLSMFLSPYDDQVVLDPFLRTFFPCVREASYRNGFFTPPKAIIGAVPLQVFDAVSWFARDSITVSTSIQVNKTTYIPIHIFTGFNDFNS